MLVLHLRLFQWSFWMACQNLGSGHRIILDAFFELDRASQGQKTPRDIQLHHQLPSSKPLVGSSSRAWQYLSYFMRCIQEMTEIAALIETITSGVIFRAQTNSLKKKVHWCKAHVLQQVYYSKDFHVLWNASPSTSLTPEFWSAEVVHMVYNGRPSSCRENLDKRQALRIQKMLVEFERDIIEWLAGTGILWFSNSGVAPCTHNEIHYDTKTSST